MDTPVGYKYAGRMGSVLRRMVAAIGAAVLLAGCGGSSEGHGGGTAETTPSDAPVITGEPAGFNADDIAFANNIIPHHKQAIALAGLVPERSTDAELIELASKMAAEQQPEVNVLNVLLVQWGEIPQLGAGAPDGYGQHLQGMVDDATMEKLKSLRGPEFDSLWLQSMISHHQGAIEMAKAEIANGENVDAVSMAKTMVASQEAEIGQMRKMLEGRP